MANHRIDSAQICSNCAFKPLYCRILSKMRAVDVNDKLVLGTDKLGRLTRRGDALEDLKSSHANVCSKTTLDLHHATLKDLSRMVLHGSPMFFRRRVLFLFRTSESKPMYNRTSSMGHNEVNACSGWINVLQTRHLSSQFRRLQFRVSCQCVSQAGPD